MWPRMQLRVRVFLVLLYLVFASAEAEPLLRHIRSTISDFEYKLHFGDHDPAARVSTQGLDASNAPVLALKDVQSSLEQVHLSYKSVVAAHTHPRAAEVLLVERGNVTSTMFLGSVSEMRALETSVAKDCITVIPQGIVHSVQCRHIEGCVFMSYHNSADPGHI